MLKQHHKVTEMEPKHAKQTCYYYEPLILANETQGEGGVPLLFKTRRWFQSSKREAQNKAKQGLRGGRLSPTKKWP